MADEKPYHVFGVGGGAYGTGPFGTLSEAKNFARRLRAWDKGVAKEHGPQWLKAYFVEGSYEIQRIICGGAKWELIGTLPARGHYRNARKRQ